METDTAKPICRSWIDIFEDCGTVFRTILNYMDEFDLYQLETMDRYDGGATGDKIDPVAGTNIAGSQWLFLDRKDRSKGANARWRRSHIEPSFEENRNLDKQDAVFAARMRGTEYIRNAIFARNRAEEARRYFDFNREVVSADDVPVRHEEGMPAGTSACDGVHPMFRQEEISRQLQQQSMPVDYWQKWIYFDDNGVAMNDKIVDVFLELSFHKDDGGTRYWRGFRKAHYDWYDKSTRIQLDLDSLVEEMGWTELKRFRDQSRDYQLRHFDVSISQQKMKDLMKKIQVTVHNIADDCSSMTTTSDHQDHRLLIATGGYSSPTHSRRDSTIIFAVNANVARFHCRNDKKPLEPVYDRPKLPTAFGAKVIPPPSQPSRSTFLRIPTPYNTDQSLEIIIKIQ